MRSFPLAEIVPSVDEDAIALLVEELEATLGPPGRRRRDLPDREPRHRRPALTSEEGEIDLLAEEHGAGGGEGVRLQGEVLGEGMGIPEARSSGLLA